MDELDLGQVFVPGDIDQSWINWREVFLSIMDLCISHATLPTRKSLPWLTKTLVNTMKKRNYYFRESKRRGDLHAFAKYKTLRNYIVMALREAKQTFFANPPPSIFGEHLSKSATIRLQYLLLPLQTMHLQLPQMLRRPTV